MVSKEEHEEFMKTSIEEVMDICHERKRVNDYRSNMVNNLPRNVEFLKNAISCMGENDARELLWNKFIPEENGRDRALLMLMLEVANDIGSTINAHFDFEEDYGDKYCRMLTTMNPFAVILEMTKEINKLHEIVIEEYKDIVEIQRLIGDRILLRGGQK